MRTFALLLLSCMLMAAPILGPAEAQVIPGPQEVIIKVNPQYPRPYDTVTVTVSSNLLDLAASAITISVNGKVIGEGERSAAFSMGGPGVKSVIGVTVKDVKGTHTGSLTLSPADVALILEPTSTVPPFYKGAKLVAPEGAVRLIALPNFQTTTGAAIAPSALSYTWKFGDKILEAQSGIGKNIFVATAPVRYRDARITVTVSTLDKSLTAQATTLVSPVDPIMRIYRNDILGGIDFASALSGTFALTSEEETFRAVPYYYATAPSLAWSLNASDSGNNSDLTVRTTGASKGTALLGVRGTGAALTSVAEARLTVQFGQARSTGIFGL